MTIPELIARIEELDRRATGGNWYTFMYSRGKDDPRKGALVAAVAPGHQIRTDKGGGTCPAFDQDFIAASRNLLPLCAKLLREAMEAERKCAGSRAVIMAMEAAMKEVGDGN